MTKKHEVSKSTKREENVQRLYTESARQTVARNRWITDQVHNRTGHHPRVLTGL